MGVDFGDDVLELLNVLQHEALGCLEILSPRQSSVYGKHVLNILALSWVMFFLIL